MRHFTKAAAAIAVIAAGSASSALAIETADVRQVRNISDSMNVGSDQSAQRTGNQLCYSAVNITGSATTFGGGGGAFNGDDINFNKPAGTQITGITFSVVSFNTDGSYGNGGTGGTITTDVTVGLFNMGVDGLPDFSSPKAIIPVTGVEIVAFTGGTIDLDVKNLNIIKKDERMWAGLIFSNVTGPANADGSTLLSGLGQFLGGAATSGFSEDFLYNGTSGGLTFFGGDPYANTVWEFRSIPTPGAMAIFGLAGLAATRRRR